MRNTSGAWRERGKAGVEWKYMRIQGREDSWVTKYPKGIFSMCWRMIMDGKMKPEDEKMFREIVDWFIANLPQPEPCRNGEKVITFFKTGMAGEMLRMIEPAVRLMDKYNHPYDIVYTNFIGTVIYEDEWQAAVRVENGKMI